MNNIPKKIHYCWFGKKPIDDMALECIESWEKNCPEYEIIRWDESNFDINCCEYVNEAYKAKKWAFVSDFARFYVLYNYGGVYFDTDVKLLKPIDPIVEKGPFMAWEENGESREGPYVAPGLGLAFDKKNPICYEIIEKYKSIHFVNDQGLINTHDNVVRITSNVLLDKGLTMNKKFQEIQGLKIYPVDYFCPMNKFTGEVNITSNTYAIHLYSASWFTKKEKLFIKFEQSHNGALILKSVPYKIIKNIYCYGLKKTVLKIKNRC